MTTTILIKIKARCSADKEVKVAINDNVTGTAVENFTVQDGETAERYVFDGREISVSEVLKQHRGC